MAASGIAIEREVKLSLAGRFEYERFARVLPTPRRWGLQLNVYLDSADRVLRSAKVSLRVRVTPDHARLTVKVPWGLAPPGSRGPTVTSAAFVEMAPGNGPGVDGRWDRDSAGAFVHSEIEIELPRELAVEWIQNPVTACPWNYPDFSALKNVLDGRPLIATCWSLTRRAICDTPAGVTIELDETVFADGFRDFELEIEYPDSEAALSIAKCYARWAGIEPATQQFSKHARARKHMGVIDWIVPAGLPTDALPPLFLDPAPESLFCHAPADHPCGDGPTQLAEKLVPQERRDEI